MNQTQIVRNESFDRFKLNLGPRQDEVYSLVREAGEHGITAWESAQSLGRMIHALRPRLTELQKVGLIESTTCRFHEETQRNESVWRLKPSISFDESGQGFLNV